MIEDSLAAYSPTDSLTGHACAAILRGKLHFADASVNTFIGFFKDTSLVLIIGIFDLLTMGKVALSDPPWQSFSTEMYISLAVIYIAFCFAMSKYSRNLERDLNRAKAR